MYITKFGQFEKVAEIFQQFEHLCVFDIQTNGSSVIIVCGDWLFISLHHPRCLYLFYVWAGVKQTWS